MQRLSIIRTIILCSSISIFGIGCTNFPFMNNATNAAQENTEEERAPSRPTEPQDSSLIITGNYTNTYYDGKPCTIIIAKNKDKTENKEFPFLVSTKRPRGVSESCYQNGNKLICIPEDDREYYFIVTQISNTEIDIQDHLYTLAFSGSSVGDAELCRGVLKKTK